MGTAPSWDESAILNCAEGCDEFAAALVRIGQAAEKLSQSGLKTETLVLLLHDATKVPKGHIKSILAVLPGLPVKYLRPQVVKGGTKTSEPKRLAS